jgi:hypothetical protein
MAAEKNTLPGHGQRVKAQSREYLQLKAETTVGMLRVEALA